MNLVAPLAALLYSAAVLLLAGRALRGVLPPVRAALAAFVLSSAVHLLTLLLLDPEYRLVALLFWAVPHALLLPLLLWRARRLERT